MKELDDLDLPKSLFYAKDHEYVRKRGETVRVGISDYAQDQLGDIVFVDLRQVGTALGKGDEFGTVESVKAVSELFMPVGGEITAVNGTLEASPQLVNQDPYGVGWLIEIKPGDPAEIEDLMDRQAYLDMLKGMG
jgi:glycine cleavage system H protein